jgi:hypothetical protein
VHFDCSQLSELVLRVQQNPSRPSKKLKFFVLQFSTIIDMNMPALTVFCNQQHTVWNGNFMIHVKKSETGQLLLFFLAFRKCATTCNLFFSNVRVCQVTPRSKDHIARNTTHYLFLESFQSLYAKKIVQYYLMQQMFKIGTVSFLIFPYVLKTLPV